MYGVEYREDTGNPFAEARGVSGPSSDSVALQLYRFNMKARPEWFDSNSFVSSNAQVNERRVTPAHEAVFKAKVGEELKFTVSALDRNLEDSVQIVVLEEEDHVL